MAVRRESLTETVPEGELLLEHEQRYRHIFRYSEVAMWEENIHGLRQALGSLRAGGVADIPAYLEANPEFLEKAAQLIEIVDVNEAALRLYELTRERVLGPLGRLVDLRKATSAASLRDVIAAVAEGRTQFGQEWSTRSASGRPLFLEIRLHIPGEEDPYPNVLVSIIDVTGRTETERALRASEERYRTLFNSINDAAFLHELGPDGRPGSFLEVNDTACRMLGYTRPELRAARPQDIETPESWAAAPWALRALTDTMHAVWEGIYVRKDGSTFAVEISNHLLGFEGKRTVLSTVRDITSRKSLERSLDRERALLATLINHLPDHVYLKDTESRFVLANRAIAVFMDAGDAAGLTGRTDHDFYTPEVADSFRRDERSVLARRMGLYDKEEHIQPPAGPARWFLTTKIPLVDAAGAVTGLVGIGRDITDAKETQEALRRSEEQLAQAQKMEAVGRLAGGVAHDFNNLLTVIRGYANLIGDGKGSSPPIEDCVREIVWAADRAADLTTRLLAFSRKQVARPRVLDLGEAVRSVGKMLPRMIGEDVHLVLATEPETGNVMADAGQIEQVILNLAINARDAMPGGGRLTIETANRTLGEADIQHHPEAPPGEYVILAVRDTGTGMSRQVLARLYEPFFTTKDVGKGTGLGLATVYGIVRQSQGHIDCRSEPGHGTVFTIYLPRVQGRDVPRDAAAVTDVPGGAETILLVEDEPAVRRLTRSILDRAGYTVLEASGGEEALARVSAGSRGIDLLVTDVVMPGMGGPELARRARTVRPDLPILCMSGYSSDVQALRGEAALETDFLPKPFSADNLLARVREILDRSNRGAQP
jgi:PAS domain S-box-containing protein